MHKPLLSIIIPIFNVEKYLAECLQSILDQDCPEIEVIMIEDGSSDGSLAIAEEFDMKFLRSKVLVHSTNQGLGPARNTGIRSATGGHLMMVDSDDWLTEDAVKIVIDDILETNSDIIQYGCNKIHKDRVELALYKNIGRYHNLTELKSALLKRPNYAWLKIYRREFVQQSGVRFENIFYEDVPWSIKLALFAKNIQLSENTIYNYRQRSGSIVSTKSVRHLEMLKAYANVYEFAENLNLRCKVKRALDSNFIDSAYFLYRQRKTRLNANDIEAFSSTFSRMLLRNKVLPSSLRSCAMLLIIFAGIFRNNWF